jgi:nitrite reductase/ring-hydroxylating ferredoxin subunit
LTADVWRPLALSEQVTADKPLAVVCDNEPIVLFRDSASRALGLEDRCPHRRVPLSLGEVKDSRLQCGYHGWTFDGATGACTAIPNLGAGERVPARYGARAFPVGEGDGFVQVWLGQGVPPDALPTAGYRPQGAEFTGTAIVGMAEDDYHGVILDGPEHLVAIDQVVVTDFFLGDPRLEGDSLVLDRGAYWTTDELGNFIADFPLIVRTTVPFSGGAVTVQLLSDDEHPVFTLLLATAANRRGTTSVCWRGHMHAGVAVDAPPPWREARTEGRPPFQVVDRIDAAAVAALLPIPSRELAFVRAERQSALAPVAVEPQGANP